MSKALKQFEQQEAWRRLSGKDGTWYQEASEEERATFRNWTREILHEREIAVTFTKADGSIRNMRCTLNEALGASVPVNTTVKTQRKNEQLVCSVWDCDKKQWRSFRWDRVKRIEFSIG